MAETLSSNDIVISGQLVSGRNIGTFMVTYNKDRIKDFLGVAPYPGTLNIALDAPLLLSRAVQIDVKGKQFVVSGNIGGIACALYRWHGAPLHIIEVIAPVQLRDTLALKDGQAIDITLSRDCVRAPSKWRVSLWRLFYQARVQVYYNDDIHKLFTGKFLKYLHRKSPRRNPNLCR